MKDWIEQGTLPLYSLRLGSCAQSGPFHSGHPIVAECWKERLPSVQEVRVKVSYGLSLPPCALFASPVSLLDIPLSLPDSGINLGWVFTPGRFPDLTPEESDDGCTPDENRLKSEKPGGINDHFLTCFTPPRRE